VEKDHGYSKDEKFHVSATAKKSQDDLGDGVINADDGKKYYFIEEDNLFVLKDDVVLVSREIFFKSLAKLELPGAV